MTVLAMLGTGAVIGWLAQAKRGRTGAAWFFLTLGILMPAWLVVYLSVSSVAEGAALLHEDAGWYALAGLVCLPVGLLLGLLVLSLPTRTRPAPLLAEKAEATKICPACAEPVRAAAIICRYCQHTFTGTSEAAREAEVARLLQAAGGKRA